jgi:Icc-related predicted phosphoesterase
MDNSAKANMKILAFTDIHGSYKKVDEILAKVSADVIVIGGDITTMGTPTEAKIAVEGWKKLGHPLLAIAGNMDSPEIDKALESAGVSVNGRGIKIGDVGFFGVSASPFSPLHTPYEISEEETAQRIEAGYRAVRDSKVKVFVPHAPPHGTKVDKVLMGTHVGSKSVRDFIEREQPDIVICGHIHEARGQDSIGKTRIVNCGPAGKGYYAVIEIGEEILITNQG